MLYCFPLPEERADFFIDWVLEKEVKSEQDTWKMIGIKRDYRTNHFASTTFFLLCMSILISVKGTRIPIEENELYYLDHQTLLDDNGHTFDIALGDFKNNDFMSDYISANFNGANQLFLSDGQGNFNSPITFGGDIRRTRKIAIGDLNQDGFLDVVFANDGSPNQVYFNNGNGGFQEYDDLIGGDTITHDIVVADMNNDSFPDIICGNWGSKNVILLNNGNGKFQSIVYLPGTFFSHSTSIAVSDVDQDNDLDIVVGNYIDGSNLLIINNDGEFYSTKNLPYGDFPTHAIEIADINSDSFPDIIVANSDYNENHLLLNDGSGNFEGYPLVGGMLSTQDIAIGDLNNDGKLDIFIGNWNSENQILMNLGNGNFDMINFPIVTDGSFAIEYDEGMHSLFIGSGDENHRFFLNCPSNMYLNSNDISSLSCTYQCPEKTLGLDAVQRICISGRKEEGKSGNKELQIILIASISSLLGILGLTVYFKKKRSSSSVDDDELTPLEKPDTKQPPSEQDLEKYYRDDDEESSKQKTVATVESFNNASRTNTRDLVSGEILLEQQATGVWSNVSNAMEKCISKSKSCCDC